MIKEACSDSLLNQNILKNMLHTTDSSFQEGENMWELVHNFIRVYIHLASMDIALLVIKILNAPEIAVSLSIDSPAIQPTLPQAWHYLENKALNLGQHLSARIYGTSVLICCCLDHNGIKYFKCNLWMRAAVFHQHERTYLQGEGIITIVFCLFLSCKLLYTSFFQGGPAYLTSVPGENLFYIHAPVWWLNFHCQFCAAFRWAAAPDDVSMTALSSFLPSSYVFFPLLSCLK